VFSWNNNRTQNPLVARPCGFDSLLRHQNSFAVAGGKKTGAFDEVYFGGIAPALFLRLPASWRIVDETERKAGVSWRKLDKDEALAC
jgi:hypothetical protein